MWEAFVGSFWLTGALAAILIVASLYWVEFCDGIMGIFIIPAFIVFVILNDKLSDHVNIWDWFIAHRLECLIGALVYFPLGAVYSVFRLWRYAAKMRDTAVEIAQGYWGKYVKEKADHPSYRTEEEWVKQENSVKTQMANQVAVAKARVEANMKGKIMGWIAIWPASLIWYLISDMVREILSWIYARMAHYYQRLVDHVFRTA